MRHKRKLFVRLFFLSLLLVIIPFFMLRFTPGLLLELIGFQPMGDLDKYWEERIISDFTPVYDPLNAPTVAADVLAPVIANVVGTPSATPQSVSSMRTDVPTPNPDLREIYRSRFSQSGTPDELTVFAEGVINESLTVDQAHADVFEIGTDAEGQLLGLIEYHEDAWQDLCITLMQFCETDIYRVQRIRFRPDGAVIYLNLHLEGISLQEIGVVMMLDPGRVSMSPAGVVLEDEIYSFPSEGRIADTLTDLVRRGNNALAQIKVQTDGHELSLDHMYFTDERLFLVLH